MTANFRTLAIIPARGGSKGLPRKNIVELGGAPLIAWSIAAARQAPSVTDVVVSTDEEEIAEIARAWGAEVPFLRPLELAGDKSSVGDAVSYTLSKLDRKYDIIVTLFPTHPFRTPELIEEALTISKTQSIGVTSAASESNLPGDFVFYGPQGPRAILSQISGPILRQHAIITVSTRFPHQIYNSSGKKHYCALVETIRRGDRRFLNPEHYLCLNDPVVLTDIDTPDDLLKAQKLIDQGQIIWSPKDGYLKKNNSSGENKFFEQPRKFTALGLSDRIETSCQLTANPLALKPIEVRQQLNDTPYLARQDVVLTIGDLPAKEFAILGINPNGKPSIAALRAAPVSLGAGICRHNLAFGYLFADRELIESVGHCIGDISSETVEDTINIDLTPYQHQGTYCSARAYDSNFGLLAVSPVFKFDGHIWQSSGGQPTSDSSGTIDLRNNGETSALDVPASTMTIEFQVFRYDTKFPWNGYGWAPLEFNGLLEYDYFTGYFRNPMTNDAVGRRQDMPPIHRWAGYVYVPQKVSADAQWNISWLPEATGEPTSLRQESKS